MLLMERLRERKLIFKFYKKSEAIYVTRRFICQTPHADSASDPIKSQINNSFVRRFGYLINHSRLRSSLSVLIERRFRG